MQKVLDFTGLAELPEFDVISADLDLSFPSAEEVRSNLADRVSAVVSLAEQKNVDAVVFSSDIPAFASNLLEQKLLEKEVVPLYHHKGELLLASPRWSAIMSAAQRVTPTKDENGEFDVEIQTLY